MDERLNRLAELTAQGFHNVADLCENLYKQVKKGRRIAGICFILGGIGFIISYKEFCCLEDDITDLQKKIRKLEEKE